MEVKRLNIEVRLFATLRQGREKKQIVEIAEGTRLAQIIEDFGIDEQDIAILLVNGMNVDSDFEPSNGDVVAIFPPVGGG